jgi:hypothetical protein
MDAVNCDATVLNEVCSQRRLGWLVVRDRKGGVKDDDRGRAQGCGRGACLLLLASFLQSLYWDLQLQESSGQASAPCDRPGC